jgi:putative AlgH/UPF0301 family transcriptional regulator
MQRIARSLATFELLLTLIAGMAVAIGNARAADLSEPVLLVATSSLDGSPFAQSVVIAAPIANGRHIGFMINKPTGLRLATLFPDDAAVLSVTDPVYLGGPAMLPGVFAITRAVPSNVQTAVPLMPGLVAVVDGQGVDSVIAATPNEARYFVGLMLWDDDDLEAQVEAKVWEVRPADADAVFRANARGLWTKLRSPSI